MALVRGMLDEVDEPGRADLDHLLGATVEHHAELAGAGDGRMRAPGRVVELQRIPFVPGPPGLGRRAAGNTSSLGGATSAPGRRSAAWARVAAGLCERVELAELVLDRASLAAYSPSPK